MAKQLKERYRQAETSQPHTLMLQKPTPEGYLFLRWRYCSEQKTTGIVFERPGLLLSYVVQIL